MQKRYGSIFVFALAGVLSFLLAACGGAQPAANETEAAVEIIRLPMGFIPNVQYSPFYVAAEKGFYREAGLEIEFDYSAETDGIALVGAGELPFTIASGEQVLLARAQGLPVVYVMTWWHDYPVAVAGAQGTLGAPADLEGQTIGLPGLYGASYIGLRALLNAAGLQESDVSLESIGFNQVEAYVAGQVESIVVYANNEPIQLQAQGYPVDVLRVADYVQLASNGLVTNETTIRDNPDLVRRFIQATLQGINETIANPDQAFEISKKYVEGLESANPEIQKAILATSIEFWQAERLGYSDAQAWENMLNVLTSMDLIQGTVELDQAYTNQFVE